MERVLTVRNEREVEAALQHMPLPLGLKRQIWTLYQESEYLVDPISDRTMYRLLQVLTSPQIRPWLDGIRLHPPLFVGISWHWFANGVKHRMTLDDDFVTLGFAHHYQIVPVDQWDQLSI